MNFPAVAFDRCGDRGENVNDMDTVRTVVNDVSDCGRQFRPKPVYDLFKRIFDIIASLTGMIVLSPVFLVTAAAILIEDGGCPFYVQERIGQGGKPFRMYKFRSMVKNAEDGLGQLMESNEYRCVHFKMENDPRITRVGKIIRPVSIDELPQLLNVLIGNMSVIGPRPFIASEQEQLPSDRLSVKPGLSCYWQTANTLKMSSEQQLELDYRYIRERSVVTDIKIILRTLVVIVRGKNQ